MEKLLITRNDIEEFFPLGKNLDNSRLLQYIGRAQQSDLKPFLGQELYFDFITNFSSTPNQTLFNGGVYAYQGKQVFFGGVRQLLAAWAYARLYAKNNDFVTRSGNTRKDTEESTPQPEVVTKRQSLEAGSEAIRLQAETWDFLDQNRSAYPLWEIGLNSGQDHAQRKSFKVTRVRPFSTVQKRGL